MDNYRLKCVRCLTACLIGVASLVQADDLRVSPNKRYLLKEGQPFFYLSDTAWNLFMRLDREEADDYLQNRTEKGFNVIMVMLIGYRPGQDDRNAYGEVPLIDKDPGRPNEKYFQHVDYIVNRANALGFWVAIAPSWSDWMYKSVAPGPHPFTPKNARSFGEYVGLRYRHNDVIWVLGGDRSPEGHEDLLRAMAAGLDEGDGPRDFLMTFHGAKNGTPMPPDGIYTERLCSSHLAGAEGWLDFHGAYSGHRWAYPTYRLIEQDRATKPIRPVIDLEPCYENHPYHPDGSPFHAAREKWDGVTRGTAALIREQAYWAVLAGAAGHTYGANDVWGFYDPGRPTKEQRLYEYNTPWRQALDFPGATQMGILRRLLESRPWYTLEPAQSIVVAGQGIGENHIQAARAADGRFLFAYIPRGQQVSVDMTKIRGSRATGYWFNPRDGTAKEIGQFPCSGMRELSPPDNGIDRDWVLVLDDAAQEFAVPGTLGRNMPTTREH